MANDTNTVRVQYFSPDGQRQRDLSVDDIGSILRAQKGVLWVDFAETPPEYARPILEDLFGLHPLAVEDALEEKHTAKVDDWGEYLCLVFKAVALEEDQDPELRLLELDCFLMPRCLVTYQARRGATVDRCWDTIRADPLLLERGAPYLLYQLLDRLMDDYMATLDALDGQADAIEDQLFAKPTEALLAEIFGLKRTLLRLRKSLGAQREVLSKLTRSNYAVIDRADVLYYRDIYDHLVRLHDIADTMRELAGSVLDMYLSVVNNRMNDVMKTLTVITTLFMPLSFLVGFFGMNFFQPSATMPAWTGTVSFGLTVGAMVVMPLLMFWWMRRRGLI